MSAYLRWQGWHFPRISQSSQYMSEDAAAVVDRKKQLIEWEHHLVRECWRQGFKYKYSVPVIETTIRKILLEDPVQKEDDVKKKRTTNLL